MPIIRRLSNNFHNINTDKFKLLAVSMTIILSGCAEFNAMPSLDVLLPKAFSQIRSGENAPQKLMRDWWKTSDDTILADIIYTVEKQNLTVEQAQYRLVAARESSRRADFLPNITASTNAQYNRLIDGQSSSNSFLSSITGGAEEKTTGYYNAQFDAAWEVPLYGQLNQIQGIKEAGVIYAEADLEAIRASVVSEAIRLYAEMRRWQNAYQHYQNIAQSQAQISTYQDIKFSAGLIDEMQVSDAKRSALLTEDDLEFSSSQLIAAQYQLATLLGLTAPYKDWADIKPVPKFIFSVLTDTPLDVLRNRPDIRRAEASVLIQAAEFQLSKSELYPKLTLGGTFSQVGNLTGHPLLGKTIEVGGIPTLSLPLFDWGQRLATARRQDAKLSEAALAYRESVITAINEVEELISAYNAADQKNNSAEKRLALSQSNAENADILFVQGIYDGIQKERMKISLAEAQIQLLEAQADQVRSSTVLAKALGGISTADSMHNRGK